MELSQLENELQKVRHDLRAPLINIDGFAIELGSAVSKVVALLKFHKQALPSEFGDSVNELMDEDVIPCLGFLQDSVSKLNRLVDNLSMTNKSDRSQSSRD